jgi:hypothetical protein
MKPTLRMKQHSLDNFATRGWAPLLDEVQLTFFYEGLPDPIVPSETSLFPGFCGKSSWRTIPRGFNLLAVSLPWSVKPPSQYTLNLGHDFLDPRD